MALSIFHMSATLRAIRTAAAGTIPGAATQAHCKRMNLTHRVAEVFFSGLSVMQEQKFGLRNQLCDNFQPSRVVTTDLGYQDVPASSGIQVRPL